MCVRVHRDVVQWFTLMSQELKVEGDHMCTDDRAGMRKEDAGRCKILERVHDISPPKLGKMDTRGSGGSKTRGQQEQRGSNNFR
jgi:hypothetical protein